MTEAQHTSAEIETLLSFLESDPDNTNILADIAALALQDGKASLVVELLSEARDPAQLNPALRNFLGLALMQLKQFREGAEIFATLAPDDDLARASVDFNHAWCLAMIGQKTDALALLTPAHSERLASVAMLRLQLLHEAGDFDGAEALARELIDVHSGDEGFMAAVSVLAIDIEDERLALEAAMAAGDHPDALSSRGTLALGDSEFEQASSLFDQALAINPHRPRSWVGKGLSELVKGDYRAAQNSIDRGAEMFGTHMGSWIASGWTAFINKDYAGSRARFERAMSLDSNFAECHGALAVVDLFEGDEAGAKQKMKTALRLDRSCFSALLARYLMLNAAGNSEAAAELFERAIHTPIQGSDRTIAQSLVGLGLRGPSN